MTARAACAYVQARLQARFGARPGAAAWQGFDASRTVAQALATARANGAAAGGLARWVDGVDDAADAHAIEAELRRRWWQHVDEVARWQGAPWREATRWFGLLPDLPAIDARRRAGGADPVAVAAAAGDGRGAWPSVPAAVDDLTEWWRRGWRRRLPVVAIGDPAMHEPAAWLVPALGGAPAPRRADDAAPAAALRRLFRRHAGRPPAVYAHLALTWLDLEHLRGGLVVRRLLGAGTAV